MSAVMLGEALLPVVAYAETERSLSKTNSSASTTQVTAEAFVLNGNSKLQSEQESFSYGKAVAYVTSGDSFSVSLNVEQTGEYYLALDYYLPKETTQNFLIAVLINGETVNHKTVLQSLWKDSAEEYSTDEYGNDVVPGSVRVFKWQNQIIKDFKTNRSDIYNLKQGSNEVTIQVLQGEALIGRVVAASAATTLPDYADYRDGISEIFVDAETQVVEGENYTNKSKASIRGRRTRNPALVPYDASRLTISTLAGHTWATPGDFVTYEFVIEEAGLYHISLKYLLDNSGNYPAYKNIYIDDELLFDGLQNYKFSNSGSQYVNHTLSYEGEEIGFYLEKGVHILRLESSAALLEEVYEFISGIVADMDALALDIKIIRGNQADSVRDWNIESFIPDVKERVTNLITRLETANDMLCEITEIDELSNASSLLIAADRYKKVLEKRDGLDDMVTGIEQFAQGSGSLAERIVNFLNEMLEQPMSIDRIYISPASRVRTEDNLPNAKVGFLRSVLEQVKQFFLSVFDEEDETNTLDKKKLNVWVIRSTAHVEEMRQLAVAFTEETGIEVNISSVLDEQKILLALASGDIPDVVCGGGLSKPYELALRGAVTDLTSFSDFEDVAVWYDPEMFVPFSYDGGCYALPESSNPWVTYYRTDIFDELGLSAPESWDEVIEILPVLYANGMSVSTLLANSASLKPLLSMYPYINQKGVGLYSEDGTEVIFLEKDFADAFVSLTELYTKYSLPHTVSNFYVNFRDGLSPLGVTDMGTYILLKNSSPDLEGRWAITDTIGVKQEDGSISNAMPLIANGSYIMKASDKQDEAWTFLKWWQSDKIQAAYSMNLQLTYGEEVLWIPANVGALAIYSPLSEEDMEVVMKRFENIKEIPHHPAYRLVERALSDAWNNVVIDGEAPLTALNSAYISANRDIVRKLKEFGYMDENGNVMRNCLIPKAEQDTVRGG